MHDRPRRTQDDASVESPSPDADRSRRVSIESPVDAGPIGSVPAAHSPRPHPPVEEPEEQPDEHAPETEPDEGDAQAPSDPPRRPPRPGKAPR